MTSADCASQLEPFLKGDPALLARVRAALSAQPDLASLLLDVVRAATGTPGPAKKTPDPVAGSPAPLVQIDGLLSLTPAARGGAKAQAGARLRLLPGGRAELLSASEAGGAPLAVIERLAGLLAVPLAADAKAEHGLFAGYETATGSPASEADRWAVLLHGTADGGAPSSVQSMRLGAHLAGPVAERTVVGLMRALKAALPAIRLEVTADPGSADAARHRPSGLAPGDLTAGLLAAAAPLTGIAAYLRARESRLLFSPCGIYFGLERRPVVVIPADRVADIQVDMSAAPRSLGLAVRLREDPPADEPGPAATPGTPRRRQPAIEFHQIAMGQLHVLQAARRYFAPGPTEDDSAPAPGVVAPTAGKSLGLAAGSILARTLADLSAGKEPGLAHAGADDEDDDDSEAGDYEPSDEGSDLDGGASGSDDSDSDSSASSDADSGSSDGDDDDEEEAEAMSSDEDAGADPHAATPPAVSPPPVASPKRAPRPAPKPSSKAAAPKRKQPAPAGDAPATKSAPPPKRAKQAALLADSSVVGPMAAAPTAAARKKGTIQQFFRASTGSS
ncbi:hypothetical protein H696_01428 [Fonticula alba]|uniref:Histone chaperone RTT106/FACT complex subunit SPT16-like middle domain-containing protein n=1 Tax=Fonticula alba TaxID=691883 RepID=A0A058ZDJ1_FONAL|nr:hypothetical protein H696_01428 [Fonticula alba]KCV72021.1 hypothetical protein H696_01428 [Fonticula alba]|eukprot:XP_009493599.1 hypothetical protein H696_01428 [Fonticula alba]